MCTLLEHLSKLSFWPGITPTFFSALLLCVLSCYVHAHNTGFKSLKLLRTKWGKETTLSSVSDLCHPIWVSVPVFCGIYFVYVFFLFFYLTLWRRIFFFNFSTPCIQNVNNTVTKYVRIMKQNTFWRGKKRRVCTMFKIFSTYICWINI